jgi:F-type H+-transporting ATPase subunit a
MHQFQISPLAGHLDGSPFVFTNSALWMLVVLALIWLFMLGGMKRQLVPGRWQVAVEGITNFVTSMIDTNIGPEGRKYLPWVFTIFIFILFANLMGMMPFGVVPGVHPFTVTSQFTITGVLAIISFSIVLIVGFWRHGFHFFSLFIPHGTPKVLLPLIFLIELLSFLVRPFSLALRLFVAMIAGHILVKVFGSFVVSGLNAEGVMGPFIAVLSFLFIAGVSALELLVCAIQAYVFALLTSLYINDAVNLH